MFDSILEPLKSNLGRVGSTLKRQILGANNERIDFLMDSFYKFTPGQRNAALVGVIGVIAIFVGGAFFLFFHQINKLDTELTHSLNALNELQQLKKTYETEEKRFEKLVAHVKRKTDRTKIGPHFEKIAEQVGVQLQGINDQQVSLSPENPLSKKMKAVQVDIRFPKISIPRMLNFLVEVEKADNFMRVQDLKVQYIYGTRLYFDVSIGVRGYQVME